MTIRVLLFASLAQQIGSRQLTLTLPDNSTVSAALDALAQQHPAIAALRSRLAVAVEMGYVGPQHLLAEGDELALIPPVSGG